jgi:hypothetical protein
VYGVFFAALHAFPLDEACELGVADDWRGHYVELGEAVLPELGRLLGPVELRAVDAWWQAFLDDGRNWRYAPALGHGDVGPEHPLLGDDGGLAGAFEHVGCVAMDGIPARSGSEAGAYHEVFIVQFLGKLDE